MPYLSNCCFSEAEAEVQRIKLSVIKTEEERHAMERKAREAELLVNRYYLHHGGGEARHGEEGQRVRAPSQQVRYCFGSQLFYYCWARFGTVW
jgi:hypothetical protein